MTDTEIDAFLTIARTGSFTKAANELYISQSSLSRRIKLLEDELGYTLFIRDRGTRIVQFTQAGQAFIQIAEKWRTLWKETREIGALNNQTVLNVLVINSINSYVMPGFFSRFMTEQPWIYLTVRTVPSVDAIRYVQNGTIDLALFSDDSAVPPPGMKPAYREPMWMVCPHSLGYPDALSAAQLDVSKHIYFTWDREYDAWWKRCMPQAQKPRVWTNNPLLIEEFLLSGDYWAIVPASVAIKLCQNPLLSSHTITDGPAERTTYYLTGTEPKQKAVNCFLSAFDQHLKHHFSESVTSMIETPAV